jgi:hypothetical protein
MGAGAAMSMGGARTTGGAMSSGGIVGSGAGGGMATGGATGAACHAAGTLNVTANSSFTAYVIDGASNPTLTFCRGRTYTFAVNSPGHPFYIKTVQGATAANAYSMGVMGNGTMVGNVTFAVPASAPATLFYDCSIHPAMTGMIQIVN